MPTLVQQTRSTILLVIALATALKICLAFFTFGTNDAGVWDSSARIIREGNSLSIYQGGVDVQDPTGHFLHHQIFNHPPFIIILLKGLNLVQDITRMPAHVSLRLLDSVADAGTIILTGAIATSLYGAIPVWLLAMVALAPAWIFISGFHANSDALMLFFLILTAYLVEVLGLDFLSVFSFALATGIKIVPLLLLPAYLLYLNRRNRVRALVVLGTFWAVTGAPWMLNSPNSFVRMIFGYRSVTGEWGIGWLLTKAPAFHYLAERAFNRLGIYLLFFAMSLTAWYLNSRSRRVSIFYQFGTLLFLFIFLTSGFGVQYLAWLSPWIVVLPWIVIAAHTVISGLFSAAVYTYWSGALPWYFANAISVGPWRGLAKLIGFLAWLTTAIVLLAYYRRLSPASTRESIDHAEHLASPGSSPGDRRAPPSAS